MNQNERRANFSFTKTQIKELYLLTKASKTAEPKPPTQPKVVSSAKLFVYFSRFKAFGSMLASGTLIAVFSLLALKSLQAVVPHRAFSLISESVVKLWRLLKYLTLFIANST